jgi:hypothetical protein
MALYPKIKPARTYPSANVTMAMRFHLKVDNPDPSLGQVGMTPGTPHLVGTIPAGSFLMPAAVHTLAVVNGTTPTLTVGTTATPAGIAVSADMNTLGFRGQVLGPLTGYTATEMNVYAFLGGSAMTVGEVDFVLRFYCQKD